MNDLRNIKKEDLISFVEAVFEDHPDANVYVDANSLYLSISFTLTDNYQAICIEDGLNELKQLGIISDYPKLQGHKLDYPHTLRLLHPYNIID